MLHPESDVNSLYHCVLSYLHNSCYDVPTQINALQQYRQNKPSRNIPGKSSNRLLVATWNVANLGTQERKDRDYHLIAELVRWFDLIAMQEIKDDLKGLRAVKGHLPQSYRLLFSDVAGNSERLTFLYDSCKVELLEKVGEVAVPPSQKRYITLPITQQKFRGFDRNPYLAAFRSGSFTFLLVNVHLYFGSSSTISVNRRSLETYAVARWADLRRKSDSAYTREIIVLGDFNLPAVKSGDPVYDALTKRGLHLPNHSTQIGSSMATDNTYDQIAFFPGQTGNDFTGNAGVFDLDGALFPDLWNTRGQQGFLAYMRYYISDHRILWAEFRTQPDTCGCTIPT